MALINFENYPSTDTAINADNLNHNFNELDTKLAETDDEIGNLSDLETVDKSDIVNAINEVKINDTGWIQLTLINGWGSHGTQWQQPSYRKVNNEVFVRGLISGGIANSVCANLPSGYRPRKTTYFIAASDSGNLASGTIAASGNLTVENYTEWIDLEFSYFTD